MSVRMIQDLLVKFKQADTIKDFTALLTDIKELFQVKEQTDVLTSESFEEVPEILKELPIVGKVSVKPSSVEEIEAEPSTAADSETQGNVFRRLKLNTVTHAHTDTKVNAKGMEISISKHLDTIAINVQKSLQQKLQNIDMHHKAPNAAPVAAPFVAPAPAPLAAAAAAPGHVPAAVGAPVGPVGGPVAAAGVPAAVPGKVAKTSATPSVSAKPAAPVAVPADGIASKFVKAGSQVAEAISKLTKSVLGSTTQAARDDVVDAVADAILSKPAQAQANPAVEVKPAVDLTAVVADALAQKPAQDQANAAPVVKPVAPAVDLTTVVADARARNVSEERV
ncbi:MAG: hypothetical protein JSR17_10990, partial [Proteobacteria bacterium]|nr:hypothetical protein [Pseudomonadota bacterium]